MLNRTEHNIFFNGYKYKLDDSDVIDSSNYNNHHQSLLHHVLSVFVRLGLCVIFERTVKCFHNCARFIYVVLVFELSKFVNFLILNLCCCSTLGGETYRHLMHTSYRTIRELDKAYKE